MEVFHGIYQEALETVSPSPPYWHQFPSIFLPHFFLLQSNLTYMKRILHLVPVKIINLKSSYDFKIDNY